MVTPAEIETLLDSLTPEEQCLLLAGSDVWHTTAIERVGIPRLRVTDGPAGARGTSFTGTRSANVPCGTALAASWNPDLVEEVGRLLGRETRSKGARVLLAPTVNLHRTPTGGRNFECQSEDPLLSARTTVAYVNGVQAEGVASCVKHFVGNDTEFERFTIDNRIDERVLRELYLVPFEAAVREANALAIMTAYNRINGPYAADSKELITDILRTEWGFEGIVMSDWFGLHSTVEGVQAGLDLEMPGPPMQRGKKLISALANGEIPQSDVRLAAHRMLTFLDRIGAFADGEPGKETTLDSAGDRQLIRIAGAAGMVLCKNEADALPLTRPIKRVAVIGPNAGRGQIMGGGSAFVNAAHVSHPLQALTDRLGNAGVEVLSSRGCTTHRTLPTIESRMLGPVTIDLWPTSEEFASGAEPTTSETTNHLRLMWMMPPAPGIAMGTFVARARAEFTPDVSGTWELALTSAGDGILRINDQVVIDDTGDPIGGSYFGFGKHQHGTTVELIAGQPVRLEVEYHRRQIGQIGAFLVGAFPPVTIDLMDEALDAASKADVSIVIVGTNDDWECEGYDRSDINLPGRQDELVKRVAEICPQTIVVVNAGSPVAMPWLDSVDAVLVTWFPGQEFGDALSDVLMGDVEPGGRLPVTFPKRYEDTPAFEHHPGRNGVAHYKEGLLVGYRWFDTVGRTPLFPFGHGLGYGNVEVISATFVDAAVASPTVKVVVRNIGARETAAVVQIYRQRCTSEIQPDDPTQLLVGFGRNVVAPGATGVVSVLLDPRWRTRWDTTTASWLELDGEQALHVGFSSAHVGAKLTFVP